MFSKEGALTDLVLFSNGLSKEGFGSFILLFHHALLPLEVLQTGLLSSKEIKDMSGESRLASAICVSKQQQGAEARAWFCIAQVWNSLQISLL